MLPLRVDWSLLIHNTGELLLRWFPQVVTFWHTFVWLWTLACGLLGIVTFVLLVELLGDLAEANVEGALLWWLRLLLVVPVRGVPLRCVFAFARRIRLLERVLEPVELHSRLALWVLLLLSNHILLI